MKLNLEQKQLLHELAEKQLNRPDADEYLGRYLKNNLINIILKIESGNPNFIQSELITIDFLRKELTKTQEDCPYNDDSMFWLNLKNQLRKHYLLQDCLLDILQHYSKRYPLKLTNSRSRIVYLMIEKMTKSKKILLSTVTEPYKIGFVYNESELLRFDLKQPLRLYKGNVSFEQYTKQTDNEFTGVYTKHEAHEILKKIDATSYGFNSFQFAIEILKRKSQ